MLLHPSWPTATLPVTLRLTMTSALGPPPLPQPQRDEPVEALACVVPLGGGFYYLATFDGSSDWYSSSSSRVGRFLETTVLEAGPGTALTCLSRGMVLADVTCRQQAACTARGVDVVFLYDETWYETLQFGLNVSSFHETHARRHSYSFELAYNFRKVHVYDIDINHNRSASVSCT